MNKIIEQLYRRKSVRVFTDREIDFMVPLGVGLGGVSTGETIE